MKKCRECPASRLPDDKGRGYCPLGFKYVIIDHQPAPPQDCPKPKTHAEAIDLYEDMES
jgi:hypothetical protein